jgi:hypothetical protein
LDCQPFETTSTFIIENIAKKFVEKNKLKPNINYITSQKEYGKDYKLIKYNLPSINLYKKVIDFENTILKEMISIAERKKESYISQDTFDEVIQKNDMKKDFMFD